MVETEGTSELSQSELWMTLWNNGDTPCHLDGVYPLLEKNQDVILAGKQDAQVYLPMCGKAPDLEWFYSKGHRVVGVEFIEAVARAFFVDNSLPFEEAECPILKCKIFQTADKRLRIFVCSVFDFNRFYGKVHRVVGVEYIEEVARGFFVDNSLPFDEAECPVLKCKIFQTVDNKLRIFVCSVFDFNKSCAGTMDIVWDRAALSSIDVELRGRYVNLMKSLLSPNFSYALWTVVYDDSTFKGFPTSMPEAVVRELFAGKGIKLRHIDSQGPIPRKYAESVTFHLWHLTE